MSKLIPRKACGQGFAENGAEIGSRLSIVNCLERHAGPFERSPIEGK